MMDIAQNVPAQIGDPAVSSPVLPAGYAAETTGEALLMPPSASFVLCDWQPEFHESLQSIRQRCETSLTWASPLSPRQALTPASSERRYHDA